jgi:uncharacterized membrane protein SpoIIM required for sporulation
MRTISEQFVLERKERWDRLKEIVHLLSRKRYTALKREQVQAFPSLYRIACGDLAEAKTRDLSPDVVEYLNNLVGQAHLYLYSVPPLKASAIHQFFSRDLPGLFLTHFKFVLLSALIFISSLLVTFAVTSRNPEAAALVVSPGTLSMMEESYSTPIAESRLGGENTLMVSFYIQHNISIGFFSFATGIFFGIGTIYFLLYNGISLGAIAGYIVAKGHGANFWTFVTAHSVLELTGLISAGAAGLVLGYALLKGTQYRRIDVLKEQTPVILSFVGVAVSLLLAAAFIEGFVSPTPVHFTVRVIIALLSLAFILWYFVFKPVRTNKEKHG